jgi:hypothetical protein
VKDVSGILKDLLIFKESRILISEVFPIFEKLLIIYLPE